MSKAFPVFNLHSAVRLATLLVLAIAGIAHSRAKEDVPANVVCGEIGSTSWSRDLFGRQTLEIRLARATERTYIASEAVWSSDDVGTIQVTVKSTRAEASRKALTRTHERMQAAIRSAEVVCIQDQPRAPNGKIFAAAKDGAAALRDLETQASRLAR
jgi:hypothetical protein